MKKYRMIVILLALLFSASVNASTDNLTQFTVAAVQLRTRDAGNFNKMRQLVREAKVHGADLVIFPEESVFLLAFKDVAEAQAAMTKLSKDPSLNIQSLYRTLSNSENPKIANVFSILASLGMELHITPAAHR